MNTAEKLMRALGVATPLIAVETPDPFATVRMNDLTRGDRFPVLQWDCVNGFTPLETSPLSIATMKELSPHLTDDGDPIRDPVYALLAAEAMPETGRIIIHGAGLLASGSHNIQMIQALRNKRDLFKATGRSIVMLGARFELCQDLATDVLVLHESLPDVVDLEHIIDGLLQSASKHFDGWPAPTNLQRADIVQALKGLSAFTAEQNLAMSVGKNGIDRELLWELKASAIGSAPGISIVTPPAGEFEAIGGCYSSKDHYSQYMIGPKRPACILWLDEGEKMFSGQADNTGVNQDLLGQMLTEMSDKHWDGTIYLGPPGTAKSRFAQTLGSQFDLPVIRFDLSAMKQGEVGASGANLRKALAVVDAISGGKVYAVMTCNSVRDIPIALQRRFKKGIRFFDLPDESERQVIWAMYLDRYKLQAGLYDPDASDGWSGAEIENCCELAYAMGCSVEEAARSIIPVSVRNAAEIADLRAEARGRYLSATHEGSYQPLEIKPVGAGVSTTERRFHTDID